MTCRFETATLNLRLLSSWLRKLVDFCSWMPFRLDRACKALHRNSVLAAHTAQPQPPNPQTVQMAKEIKFVQSVLQAAWPHAPCGHGYGGHSRHCLRQCLGGEPQHTGQRALDPVPRLAPARSPQAAKPSATSATSAANSSPRLAQAADP